MAFEDRVGQDYELPWDDLRLSSHYYNIPCRIGFSS